MWKEAFRPISLSFLNAGLLLTGRHLQVRNLTSIGPVAGQNAQATHSLWQVLWMPRSPLVGWVPAHLGYHMGGAETRSWPHLSSSTALPWPPISPGPAKRPPPMLAPAIPLHTEIRVGFLKMSSCWHYPLLLTHQWLPVVLRRKSKCLQMIYLVA